MVTPGGLVVLTDRRLAGGGLVPVVEAAVRGGAGWVILRERDLPYAARRALADQLRELLPAGRLIVAGPDPLGGDAVHLAEADPVPLDEVALVGRSCHGVPRLSTEDYVTLSPIYPTETKPGYGPALGPEAAARMASSGPVEDGSEQGALSHGGVPWLALGGITSPAQAAACAAVGARGIAVLGAVMRARDPEQAAGELAAAFAAGRRSTGTGPAAVAAGRVAGAGVVGGR
ncbi:MAG: thiamine phosphate synthase [Actinoplanes sp.]